MSAVMYRVSRLPDWVDASMYPRRRAFATASRFRMVAGRCVGMHAWEARDVGWPTGLEPVTFGATNRNYRANFVLNPECSRPNVRSDVRN
jgi:hypothetical protein